VGHGLLWAADLRKKYVEKPPQISTEITAQIDEQFIERAFNTGLIPVSRVPATPHIEGDDDDLFHKIPDHLHNIILDKNRQRETIQSRELEREFWDMRDTVELYKEISLDIKQRIKRLLGISEVCR